MASNAASVSLLGRLRLQAQQWQQGVDDAKRSLGQFTEGIRANREASQAAGLALAAYAAAGVIQLRQAVRVYTEFGQAIQNVRAVAGATEAQFRDLEAAAIRVGATTRLNANQAAEALYNLASAGLDAEESIGALEGVTNLALATLSDMGTASQLVTATLTQFGFEAEEATRVADVFANAIAQSPANMRRLTDAMRQAGPTASALGLSLEETVAAVEALFAAGLEGGQAGASIRFFMTALLNPTEDAREVLEDLGLTMADVNPQIVGIEGALRNFSEANLTAAQAIQIFSTRGATAYLSLAAQGADRLAELEEGVRISGTAARVATEQMDTFKGSLDQLSSAIESARIIAGGFVASVLRPLVDLGTRVVSVFNSLPRPVQAVATGLGVASIAAAALGAGFIAVSLAGTRLTGIFAGLLAAARGLPAAIGSTIVALRTQVAAFGEAVIAAGAYAVSVARAALVQLRPRNLILNLTILTERFRAASLAATQLRFAAIANIQVLPGLARAIRAVTAAAAANPVIAALTVALLGLSAIVAGVRTNFGGLGDAWAELRRSFAPLQEVLTALVDLLGDSLATAVSRAIEGLGAFIPIIAGPLLFAARSAASALGLVAGTIENIGNSFLLLKEIVEVGPFEALRRYAERSQDLQRRQIELNRRIWRGLQDVTDATEAAGDAAEVSGDQVETWQEALGRIRTDFEGQELITELETLLERYKDNEQAVLAIGAALTETREEFEGLVAEAEKLSETFGDRFENIRISLIEDDEARQVAEVRNEFEGLREELRAAIAENSEFAATGGAFIAESYALEAERIRRIREEARQDRLDEEREAAEELDDLISEREEAVTQLVIEGTANRVERIRLEFAERYAAAVETYEALEERAQGNREALERIATAKAAELTAIEEAATTEVLSIYDEAYDSLEERQRDFLRAGLEAAGDDTGLLRFDYSASLREANAFYDELAETAAGNAALLAQIEEQRGEELLRIGEEYTRDATELWDDFYEELGDRESDLAIRAARGRGDLAEVERLEYQERLEEATSFYAELERKAGDDTVRLRQIAELRQRELAQLLAEYEKALEEIDTDKAIETVEGLTETLLSELDGANLATLESMREQLLAWRRTYHGREGVVALIDEALGEVEAEIEESTDRIAEQIREVIEDAAAFVGDFDAERATVGLSALEESWLEAADVVNGAQSRILALQGELATANAEQRAEIEAAIADLQRVVTATQEVAVREAARLVDEATEAYQDGLAEARRAAGTAAVGLAEREVRDAIGQVVAVNEAAAIESRANLVALIDRLAEEGIGEALLAPLEDQVARIDALLARTASNASAFAAEEYAALREIADAVLEDNEARRVRLTTLQREVELSREALEETRARQGSLEDVREATRNATNAQLAYLRALQGEIRTLQDQQDALRGALPTLQALGDALGLEIPTAALSAQRTLVNSLFDAVVAAQEGGAAFADYKADLDEATRALEDYRATARQAVQDSFDAVAEAGRASIFGSEVQAGIDDLEASLIEVFDVPARRARQLVISAIQAAREAPPGEFAFLDFLEQRLEEITGEPIDLEVIAPDSATEAFQNLADEAARAPETVDELQIKIEELESDLEGVRDTIAEAMNFDAAVDGIISGFQVVTDRIAEESAADFTEIGEEAADAYSLGFAREADRLRDELTDAIGAGAEAAGNTAGQGLIAAFVQGIRDAGPQLEQEVQDLLQRIREYLPSSDAKRGPLSDLTASGRALISTLAAGAESQSRTFERQMGQMLGGILPAGGAFRNATAGAQVAAAPIYLTIEGSPAQTPGSMGVNVRNLMNDVDRELQLRGLARRG